MHDFAFDEGIFHAADAPLDPFAIYKLERDRYHGKLFHSAGLVTLDHETHSPCVRHQLALTVREFFKVLFSFILITIN